MIQSRRSSKGRRERQNTKSRHVRTQRRWLQPEQLEGRMMMAANPFHNGFWPEDVNNDLRVTAIDALQVINALNQGGSRELLAPGEVAPDMADVPFYTDVSADGALSAVDALRVVNMINSGEGEIAPSDVVRFRLGLTDVNGNALANNTVNVGQTFQVRGYVQDVRLKAAPDPGSTTAGNATGVFAAYMDVLMSNASLATIRYGETQEVKMDATHPGDVWGSGTFRLTYAGQQTAPIEYLASRGQDAAAIQAALEALPAVGVGNVQVTTLEGASFDGRYFVRFVRALGERDVAAMTVQGTNMLGSTNGVMFTPQPAVVDNAISVNPTTPEQQEELFRSSFVFVDPYLNGPSAVEEPLEAGQSAGSRNLGEIGAFLNRFSLNSPPTYTPRLEYLFFTLDVRADQGGSIQFMGNVAEINKTLVFGQSSGKNEVDPANIGFIDPASLTIAAPINVVGDTRTVLEDSTVTGIPVLANDSVNGTAGGVAPLALVTGGLSAVTPAGSATVSISGSNVNFTPAKDFNGQVTFTYQVRDSKPGTPNTATGTVTVTVTPVNDPPVVTNDTQTVQEDATDTPINVLANDNAGPANEPQALTVSAVGTPDQGGTVQIGAGGANVVYRTKANFFGTEKFTYTARDSDGATAVGTVTVTVNAVNDSPDAVNDTFVGILEDSNPTVFNVLVNDSPGPLEAPPVDTITIVGVGLGSQGGTVTFTATNVSYKPAANFFGQETFTYTIRDGGGLEDTATVSVTVVNVNDLPDAVGDTFEVDELSTNNVLAVLANDNPGPLEAPPVDAILVVGTTNPSHGTVTIGAGGANVVYTPSSDYFGPDSFTYTIRDNGGLQDTATVTIDVVPVVRPRARPDAFDVQEDATASSLDVLANDLPNVEPAGTKVTLKSFGQPTHGVVTLLDNGTPTDLTDDRLQYVPAANYFGDDSFNYTINDTAEPKGQDSIATVTIRVTSVNDPPTLDAISNPAAILEDAAQQTVNLTGITAGPLETQSLQVTAVSSNTGLIPNPTATYTSPTATGTLRYTPVANQSGTAIVTVTVKDAGLDGTLGTQDDGTVSQSFTVTVTPVNDAPTIKAPAQVATKQDQDITFALGTSTEVSVNDIDTAQLTVGLVLQSDPLTPAVDPGNLILGTTSGVTITAGSDNSDAVTFTGTLAAVNAALNGLKYDVTGGYEGMPSLQVSVSDGEFTPTVTVGIIVSGINDPPVNVLPGPVQVAEDNDLFFNGNLRVTDPDAGLSTVEVTLSATNGTLTPVANPNVTVTPMGTGSLKLAGSIVNINAALNGLKYRPNQDYNGAAQLVISTNDKGNTGDPPAPGQTELIDTDTLAITVTPVNDAPVANDDGSPSNRTTVLWNTTDNSFAVLANDNTGPDTGETLTITNVDATDAHGTVTIDNGKLLYTPTPGYIGDAQFIYTVNDRINGDGLADTATVYVTVVDFVPSDVSGYVYFDADNDGIKDPVEWGIGGVLITLTGVNIQGNPESRSALTDETGMYEFTDVMPSNTGTKYTLTEFHPAALVDGKDTAGDQGAEMSANDQMRIYLPLFGYAEGILGAGNNFGELGFRAEFAGQGLHDLIHSGPNGGGLLIGTDLSGNLQWYINLGGWEGYIPGLASPTSPSGFNAAVHDGKLSLTGGGTVQEIDSTDVAIRSMFSRAGGLVTSILGDAGDFGLPMPLAAAGGEGEGNSLTAVEDDGLPTDSGDTGEYEAAVDALFAGIV